MTRIDRREPLFQDDQDRERFLKTLGETCERTGWRVHAWCLMNHYFHLVVETPKPNLTAGMKWLLGTYTSRFNLRHGRNDNLFRGRYKSVIVGGSPLMVRDPRIVLLVTFRDYVLLDPVRAKLLQPVQPLKEYRWSSYPEYLKSPEERVAWLRVDGFFEVMGLPQDSPEARRQLEVHMEERQKLESGEAMGEMFHSMEYEALRRQLALRYAEEKVWPIHYGLHRMEWKEEARLAQEELDRQFRGI
jgi:hypothetical protein